MAETTSDVYANAAGLLARMGYAARAEEAWTPPPSYPDRGPFPAIVTDAPPVLVGFAIGQVAEEPEAHLPDLSVRAGRVPAGQAGEPPWAYWLRTP